MSEEAYSLIAAITAILYAFVLYHRWQQGRALRRLKKLLDEQKHAEQERTDKPTTQD